MIDLTDTLHCGVGSMSAVQLCIVHECMCRLVGHVSFSCVHECMCRLALVWLIHESESHGSVCGSVAALVALVVVWLVHHWSQAAVV